MTLITFLFVLTIIVLVHELGHFLAARWRGIGVEEFGLGFPPRIIGWQRDPNNPKKSRLIFWNKKIQSGEPTVYSLNLIPLGGFVKIKGEDGQYSNEKDSFSAKKIWERSLVVLMGVFGNVFLTFILFTVGFSIGFPQALGDKISSQAIVSERQVKIVSILKESPAEKANLLPGDVLLKVDGQEIVSTDWFRKYVREHINQEMQLVVKRDSNILETKISSTLLPPNQTPGIGVAIADVGFVRYPFWLAPFESLKAIGLLTKTVILYFGEILKNLFARQAVSLELAGPVGIAVLTGEAAKLGWLYLLQFISLLSLNLAIINVLPFPALDGGRFLFLLIEKIKGRPVSQKVESFVHNLGFILLLILVVFVTYQDIFRFKEKFPLIK